MIATAMPAAAQTVADGSVDAATAKQIVEWLDRDLRDPLSTQLRKVRQSPEPNFLCGELNQKNEFGGYVGFRPFWVDTTRKEGQTQTADNEEMFNHWYPETGCI